MKNHQQTITWLLPLLVALLCPMALGMLDYKGMTVTAGKYCPNVTFSSDRSYYTLKHLKTIGVNWIAVVVTEYQDHGSSLEIYPVTYKQLHRERYYWWLSESIEELTFIIQMARSVGIKVMLKPHIDQIYDGTMNWRGEINPTNYTAWSESYTFYMMKYARLAKTLDVEMLSIECELIGAGYNPEFWRPLTKKVREVYSGPLTASANYGGEESGKQWWDVMDFIGIDAYYTGVRAYSPTPRTEAEVESQGAKAWENIDISAVKPLSEKFNNKPVLFTELGFCTGGACVREYTPTEQDLLSHKYLYQSVLTHFEKVPHWKGIFWWGWMADGAYGGAKDSCMSPQYKPAEDILRKFYNTTLPRMPKPFWPATCMCTI